MFTKWLYNSTKSENSQYLWLFYAFFLLILLIIFLTLDASFSIKLTLAAFFGLIPIFVYNPLFFLIFVFLLTPSLRVESQTDVLFQGEAININFNALMHAFIIAFGALITYKNRAKIKSIFREFTFFKLLLALAGLATLSLLYTPVFTKTLEDIVRLLSTIMIFISCFLIINDKKTFYTLLIAMVLGGIYPAAVGAYQFATGAGWWDWTMKQNRIFGTLIHPNSFAYFMLSLIPIAYALFLDPKIKKQKMAFFFLVLAYSFLLFASYSRGAWISFSIIVFVYSLLKNKKIIFIGVLAFFLVFAFSTTFQERVVDIFNPTEESSVTGRLNTYKRSLPAFEAAPILGHGFSSFEEINLKYNEEAIYYTFLESHNDYLRLLIELGLVGLAVYVLIFFYLLKYLIILYRQLAKDNVLRAYVFSAILVWLAAVFIALGDNLLRTVPLQYAFWGYTAVVLGYYNLSKEEVK